MPSVIPYDSSIVLGNIVDPRKIEILNKICEIQAPADAAEAKMNDLISFKRSIDNTIQELGSMNVSTNSLYEKSVEVGKEIEEAALTYANAKLAAKKEILDAKSGTNVNASWESPLDYNRTQIKQFPLSADSMNMNVQYFSVDENTQSAKTQSQNIQAFISSEFKFLGNDFSEQASKAAASQVNSQYSQHDISGTLVIAVSCTHKNAAVLAPCVIDVDKAIRVWNQIFTDDLIRTDNPSNMIQIASQAGSKNEKELTVVSGATYGSCFVGMIHVLNNSITMSSEKIKSIADSIQAQCNVSKWMADISGGFGVGNQMSEDIKNLFSMQNIASHCTITTRGAIPSIKSNTVKLAVQQFSKFDGEASMEKIAALQNATASAKDSIDKAAESARTGQQMISLQNAQIQGVLTGLSQIDDGENKMLDINSLMTALEDYIDKALSGNLGMPVNYYLKPITRSELAEMWVDKYFPNKFLKVNTAEGE